MEELCEQIERCETDYQLCLLECSLKQLELELLRLQKEIQFGALAAPLKAICTERRKLLRTKYRGLLRTYESTGKTYDVPAGVLPGQENDLSQD